MLNWCPDNPAQVEGVQMDPLPARTVRVVDLAAGRVVVPVVGRVAAVTVVDPAAVDNVDEYGACDMRVLIVEDNRALGQQIAEALRAAGYVAEISCEGEDALFRGRAESFDAIILDLGLPQLDGL